jgi:predicted AAA+ superfamily ATPase
MKKCLAAEDILILTGIRRSGKSALAYLLAERLIREGGHSKEDFLFINLEDPALDGAAMKDLLSIYEVYSRKVKPGKKPIVVLDEAQNVTGWEKFSRMLAETEGAKCIITGSNSSLLEGEYAEALSGRYLLMEVLPLSFGEFLSF